MVWLQDLPVCFPGRECVPFAPASADLLALTSALTPVSPAIAAGAFTVVGAALVLIVLGVRGQWRRPGVRIWLIVTVISLLLVGFVLTSVVDHWFTSISAVYSGTFGQRSAPAPASLAGSWRMVLAAGHAMEILAVAAGAALAAVALLRRRPRDEG